MKKHKTKQPDEAYSGPDSFEEGVVHKDKKGPGIQASNLSSKKKRKPLKKK